MKFSENWLRTHVSTAISREALCDTLTAIGLEVESATVLGKNFDHVVVARIISADPHPQADRLKICSVDSGGDEPVQIVCGAPNARSGLCAPLAKIGAQIGPLTIKAAKLRGVESRGMLCSAKELGLDDDASGLMELPADAPVGTPLAQYLNLPDACIEIKLTPNRADCFSVRGIAFDVAAATGTTTTPFTVAPITPQTQRELAIELQAGALAPRYLGRIIEGINPQARTPLWMAERLRRSGVRPISLLVDITQYVMLELGQPMHAYDLDTLHGPIGVRPARAGEPLKLLDGREVTLDEDFLLITDADRAIGLAGIMGGFDTRVTPATTNVFLEAAHFAPHAILGQGRKLGLHTDAGHRFERGVDPQLPAQAIEYATQLILELAGGTPSVVSEAVRRADLPSPPVIHLRRQRIARILGLSITDTEVERILRALDMRIEIVTDGWMVHAPSRRFDISIEEDVIEELARIHGYNRIPTTLPRAAAAINVAAETRLDEASVRRHLASRDLLETINYAFVDATWLQPWGIERNQHVVLANPLSAELAVMRPMLLPGLIAALGRNIAHQATRVRLFEIGNVFAPPAETGSAPQETLRLAAAVCGLAHASHWSSSDRMVDFYDLKGDLESLAAACGAELAFHPETHPFAHPQRSAGIWRNAQRIGWIGQLHPRLPLHAGSHAEAVQAIWAFELDLEPLLQRPLPRLQPISKFPSVRRDLALVVDAQLSWNDLAATVRHAAGPLLNELQLFDHYTGESIESGSKSVAIGLILQDKSRTLTTLDSAAVEDAVLTAVAREHGARLRT